MEIGTVRQVDIDQEMQVAYLDYAMSVIVARALPDVRDGLKPVHRRILYAMYDMGLHPTSPYKKSARIVGEVLGKYHPHGDAAVYESMVRMAQDFSMRYMLVDGQGNFGSVDGDSAAAMRYTEARLQRLTEEILSDIGKETVDFGPNFDGSLKEPLVLPSAFPNLIVNGSSGIAVGMATNIPPHNLAEVCDALTYVIDNYKRLDDIAVDELMRFIKGPDFPTGGIVYTSRENGGDGSETEDHLRNAYAVGRGRITVQAKAHIEEMSRNRHRIVVTELPYQVNKSRLIERIAELVRDGRLEGITDLRDESDRQGMRIVIELTRTVEPRQMLSELFRLTPMRDTFSIMMLALVDGEPRTLSLRRMLFHYVDHRKEIITRRSRYDLARARERAHILEGLLVALAHLDEVIQIIRRSPDAEAAHANLRKRFKLTDVQVQAILDMPLRRLAALERQRIEAEYKEKLQLIAYLEDILAHPEKILGLIKVELAGLKKKYGDARRTQIVQGQHSAELTTTELLPDEDSVVVFEAGGQVRREPENRRYLLALGQGDQVPRHIVLANARDTLACLTTDGRAIPIAAHVVPHIESQEKKGLGDLIRVGRSDEIVAVTPLPPPDSDNPPAYLLTLTAAGKIKRTTHADVAKALARGETSIMNVDAEDRLLWAALTPGERDLVLASAKGKGIRFNEEEVRASGLGAGGVLAIKLDDDDRLVGAGLADDVALLLTVSENGFGKVSPLSEYPTQKRYGSGIVAAGVSHRTGRLVTAAVVRKDEQTVLVTARGRAARMKVGDFPALGRPSQGRPVLPLQTREVVTGAVFLVGTPAGSEAFSTEVPEPEEPAGPGKTVTAKPIQIVMEPLLVGEKGKPTPKVTTKDAKTAKSTKGVVAEEEELELPVKPPVKAQVKTTVPTATPKATAKGTTKDAKTVKSAKGAMAEEEELELPVKPLLKARAKTTVPTAVPKATTKDAKTAKSAKGAMAEEELELPVKPPLKARAKTTVPTAVPKATAKGTTKGAKAAEVNVGAARVRATKAEEEELDVPVKPRATRKPGRAPAGRVDDELELPVQPRRARRPAVSAAKPVPAKPSDKGTGGKTPRRITSVKPKS